MRWSPGELNSEEQVPRPQRGDLGGQRWQLRTKPGRVPGDRGPGSPFPVPGWPGFWINAQEVGDALGQVPELGTLRAGNVLSSMLGIPVWPRLTLWGPCWFSGRRCPRSVGGAWHLGLQCFQQGSGEEVFPT